MKTYEYKAIEMILEKKKIIMSEFQDEIAHQEDLLKKLNGEDNGHVNTSEQKNEQRLLKKSLTLAFELVKREITELETTFEKARLEQEIEELLLLVSKKRKQLSRIDMGD